MSEFTEITKTETAVGAGIDSSHAGHAQWHINRAIRALPCTLLLRAPESRLKYEKLVSNIGEVLSSWSRRWVGRGEWQSFLNRKSFCHEVEEAVVPISEIIALVEHRHAEAQLSTHIAPLDVVDLCCGKGFFAMILSYLAPKYPLLEKYIRRIVIVEKNGDVKWNHIHACNADVCAVAAKHALDDTSQKTVTTKVQTGAEVEEAWFARIHVEVWANTNIHSEAFERQLLSIDHSSHSSKLLCTQAASLTASSREKAQEQGRKQDIVAAAEVGLVFVGIHLCKRLSSRFVELANMFQCRKSVTKAETVGAVLAPCCLPRFSGTVYVQARAVVSPDGGLLCGLVGSNATGPSGTGANAVSASASASAEAWNKNMCWRCGQEGHARSQCTAPVDAEAERAARKRMKLSERLEKSAAGLGGLGEGRPGPPVGYSVDQAAFVEMDMTKLGSSVNPFQTWCEFLYSALGATPHVFDPVTTETIDNRDGAKRRRKEILRVELADGVRHGVGGAGKGVVAAESSGDTVAGAGAANTAGDKHWNDARKTTWVVMR